MALDRENRAECWNIPAAALTLCCERQRVVARGIGPPLLEPQSGRGQLLLERLAPELRGNLGAQLLALGEVDVDPERLDVRVDRPPGSKPDVDPLLLRVPAGHVLEVCLHEVGSQ